MDPITALQSHHCRAVMGKPEGLGLGSPVVEGKSKHVKPTLEGTLSMNTAYEGRAQPWGLVTFSSLPRSVRHEQGPGQLDCTSPRTLER